MSYADRFTSKTDGWTTISTRPKGIGTIKPGMGLNQNIVGRTDVSGNVYVAPALRPKNFDDEFPVFGSSASKKPVTEFTGKKFSVLVKEHADKDAEDLRIGELERAAIEREKADSRILDGIPSLSTYLRNRHIHEEQERRRKRRVFDTPPESDDDDVNSIAEPEPEISSHDDENENHDECEAYDAEEFNHHR